MMLVPLHICFLFFFGAIAGQEDFPKVCQMCNCSHDNTFGGVLVQCSDRNLSHVPPRLPTQTTTLLLDNNRLRELTGRTFATLNRLKRLNISRNSLTALDEDSFVGLSELEELGVGSNRLLLNESIFTSTLFKPLTQLVVLRLNNNCNPSDLPHGASYPDASFQHLTSLQNLYIDGLPADFGLGFLKLTKLKNLTLSGVNGYCTLSVLKNSTFIHVPYVEWLNIAECQITDAEIGTFSPLKRIHAMDVSQNHGLGFRNLSRALYGLQESSIQILKMNFIYPHYGACSRLDKSDIIYLKHTSLRELHMDGNGITELESGTLTGMPKSLEILSARENRFSYGIYIFELANMPSLRYIDLTYLNRWHRFPLKRDVSSDFNHSLSFPIPFPPKVETLILSRCYLRGTWNRIAIQNNSLKNVLTDHNLFTSISGPIYGLNKLMFLNFSHNIINNISLIFPENQITNLDLSYNILGDSLGNDENVFANVSKLQHLNVTQNRIGFLPKSIFNDLGQLRSLVIAHNDMDEFDINLEHLIHLRYLDLGYNKLQSLPNSVQQFLDELSNVTIRLIGNPLSCTCHNIDFIRWMKRNLAFIVDLESTTCILSSGGHMYLNDLDNLISDLQKQCISYSGIFLTCASLFILIMITMCLITGYRYRWKLRRMYYVGRRKKLQVDNDVHDMYTYDAFVSYADADRGFVKNVMIRELEDKADMRLCIHDRDFIPGTVIASNIANAIQNSRKTLIIVSPSFLESDWCHFEYNIARAEGVSRRENVVVAVVYRPVQPKDMPRDMTIMFAQYSYLQYDINGYDNEIFWQNMCEAINTNVHTDE